MDREICVKAVIKNKISNMIISIMIYVYTCTVIIIIIIINITFSICLKTAELNHILKLKNPSILNR